MSSRGQASAKVGALLDEGGSESPGRAAQRRREYLRDLINGPTDTRSGEGLVPRKPSKWLTEPGTMPRSPGPHTAGPKSAWLLCMSSGQQAQLHPSQLCPALPERSQQGHALLEGQAGWIPACDV